MMDDDKRGTVDGMRIGRGNRSARTEDASIPLCPLQIQHDLTCAPARAAAMRKQRLTARVLAGLYGVCLFNVGCIIFVRSSILLVNLHNQPRQ